MLMVGGASHNPEQKAYDRRRRQGAGAASDVWSLGCLLYELVTGALWASMGLGKGCYQAAVHIVHAVALLPSITYARPSHPAAPHRCRQAAVQRQ